MDWDKKIQESINEIKEHTLCGQAISDDKIKELLIYTTSQFLSGIPKSEHVNNTKMYALSIGHTIDDEEAKKFLNVGLTEMWIGFMAALNGQTSKQKEPVGLLNGYR